MYRLYLDKDFSEKVQPPELVKQVELMYESVREMRDISEAIYTEMREFKPDAVLLFANGGWPIGFSLMRRNMEDSSLRRNIDDFKLFHVFPGLNWNKQNEGSEHPAKIYKSGISEIVEVYRKNSEVNLLAVDTTNTGHATSRIFNCTIDSLSAIEPPLKVNLRIVGIFGLIKQKNIEKDAIPIGIHDGTEIKGVVPDGGNGWTKLCDFEYEKQIGQISVNLRFLPISEIPSEDNEKLVGISLMSDALGLETSKSKVQVETLLPGGRRYASGAMDFSGFFIDVISDKRGPYFSGCEAEMNRPEVAEKDKEREAYIKQAARDFMKLTIQDWDTRHGSGESVEAAAKAHNGLLDGIELYEVCKNSRDFSLAGKIRASFIKLDESTLSKADKEELAEQLVGYFCRCRSDLTAKQPDEGNWQSKLEWWFGKF